MTMCAPPPPRAKAEYRGTKLGAPGAVGSAGPDQVPSGD